MIYDEIDLGGHLDYYRPFYTVSHETCHFIFNITAVYLGGFLHFMYQWKE